MSCGDHKSGYEQELAFSVSECKFSLVVGLRNGFLGWKWSNVMLCTDSWAMDCWTMRELGAIITSGVRELSFQTWDILKGNMGSEAGASGYQSDATIAVD